MKFFTNKKTKREFDGIVTARKLIKGARSINEAMKLLKINTQGYSFVIDRTNKDEPKVRILQIQKAKPFIETEAKRKQERLDFKQKKRAEYKKTDKYEYQYDEIGNQWVNVDDGNKKLQGNNWVTFRAKFTPFGNGIRHDENYFTEAQFKNLRNKAKDDKKINTRTISYNFDLKKPTPIREIVDTACRQSFIDEQVAFSDVLILYIDALNYAVGQDVAYAKIVMRGTKLIYKLLGDTSIVNKNIGQCCPDYIMYEFKQCEHFKKTSRVQVMKHFNKDGSATYPQVFNLAKSLKYVRVDVVNALGSVIDSYIPDKVLCHLVFIINNGHCYPILSKELKKSISRKKRLDLGEICCTIKFDGNYTYVNNDEYEKNEDDIIHGNYQNQKKVVLFETDKSFNEIAQKVIKDTNYILYNIKFRRNDLEAFEHPISKQIYMATENFESRKKVCETFYKQIPNDSLRFNNQSWQSIGKSYLQLKYGNIPTSQYGPDYLDIMKRYRLSAYIARCIDNELINVFDHENGSIVSYDYCRYYTSILNNMMYDYPVYTCLDEKEKYDGSDIKCGEYYINKTFYMGKNTIKISRGWYPWNFVNICLHRQYITKDDITMQFIAKKKISCDQFKGYCKEVYDLFGYSNEAKDLINHPIGWLGKANQKLVDGAFTDDLACAFATKEFEEKKGRTCELDIFNDLYFIKSVKTVWLTEGHIPIHRQIIAQSYIMLDVMHEIVTSKVNCDVLGYTCDAIKVWKKDDKTDPFYFNDNIHNVFMNKEKQTKKVGEIYLEGSALIRGYHISKLEEKEEDTMKENKWNVQYEDKNNYNDLLKFNNNNSCLNLGVAGCGKTEMIKKMLKDKKMKMIGFCFTNNAVFVINNRSGEHVFRTFDSFFSEHQSVENHVKELNGYDKILIDEISMVPTKLLNMLMLCKNINDKIQINAFGDFNQCQPVEDLKYDYKNSILMKTLFDYNLIEMLYKPELGRYDKKLYDILMVLLESGKLSTEFHNNEIDSYVNICYLNATRKRINEKCLQKFLKENRGKKYQIGKMIISKNMPVVVHEIQTCDAIKAKEFELMVSNKFKVDSVDEEKEIIYLSNEMGIKEVPFKLFIKCFDYAFCMTTYKYQGSSINQPFNIYDCKLMDLNILYTAISRSTSFDFVHLVGETKEMYHRSPVTKYCSLINMKVKLCDGIVYKISGDDWVYIGKTLNTLEDRYKEHLEAPTSDIMFEKLKTKHSISAIQKVLIRNDNELRKLEDDYIRYYINNGFNVVNVKNTKKYLKEKTDKEKKNVEVKIEWKNETRFTPICDINKKAWRIIYRDEDGKRKEVLKRFGKCSKEEAYDAIMIVCNQLREKYC